MKYGYIRVSTKGQAIDGNSIEAQRTALLAAGAESLYIDTYTGGKMDRPKLDMLLYLATEGDVIIVTKIDRFARTISKATDIIEELLNRGISINILNLGVLDKSSTSVLIRNMMLAFAQFERDMIVERTQEGKAIARTRPGFREGRPPKYCKEQINLAMDLLDSNSYNQVSKMTGISKSTLQRARKNLKQ